MNIHDLDNMSLLCASPGAAHTLGVNGRELCAVCHQLGLLPGKVIPINQPKENETMLTVGDKLPEFKVKATVANTLSDSAFTEITDQSHKGKWKVLFFWPKDFTFICPTEIAEFGRLNGEFADRDAVLLGASVDSEFVHLAWRQHKAELKDLPFPMLADIKRELSHALGILDREEGVAKRATFIVDPENIIRFVDVTDMSVGRNPKEVLRVLDALQTDELCPCNWQPGQETIDLNKAS